MPKARLPKNNAQQKYNPSIMRTLPRVILENKQWYYMCLMSYNAMECAVKLFAKYHKHVKHYKYAGSLWGQMYTINMKNRYEV